MICKTWTESMFYKIWTQSMFYKTWTQSMFSKSSPCFSSPVQSMFYNMPINTKTLRNSCSYCGDRKQNLPQRAPPDGIYIKRDIVTNVKRDILQNNRVRAKLRGYVNKYSDRDDNTTNAK